MMSSARGIATCGACQTPIDPNGSVPIYTASECKHKVCEPCWNSFGVNTNGEPAPEQVQVYMFCGNTKCLSNSPPATAASDGYVRGHGNWRHQAEGIRLCEAIVHDEVKEMFKNRLRVMGAAQLDTGIKDIKVVYHKVAQVFNNREWQPTCRYDLAATAGKAKPETFNCGLLDAEKVKEKLADMRKVRSKALANLSRSGKHNLACPDEISRFCRDKPPNGNIWWDVFYMIMLEREEPFQEILQTLSDALSNTARRESLIGNKRNEETSARGQSAAKRAKRHREMLDAALQQHEEDVLPSESVSNAGSTPRKSVTGGSGGSVGSGGTDGDTFVGCTSQLAATERAKEEAVVLHSVMQLMEKLSNSTLPPNYHYFLTQQLDLAQKKLLAIQGPSFTPPKPSPSSAADAPQDDPLAGASTPSHASFAPGPSAL